MKIKTGVIGSGAMGAGIAQISAANGHPTVILDSKAEQLAKCKAGHEAAFAKLAEKGKLTPEAAAAAQSLMHYSTEMNDLAGCGLVIEAITENAEIKRTVFARAEAIVGPDCMLATNTSSLSVTALAGGCARPERFLGIHFFNPAPVMPLVEIVPALQTNESVTAAARALMDAWGKTTVLAKDTPGFIVNRVARPFYSEAIRIYEEGIASAEKIDSTMRAMGFRMGPFELMDFIGNDVNLAVTRTVWEAMFFDPRYRPSLTQQKLVEAGRFGRKSGRGYYDYANGATPPTVEVTEDDMETIGLRILSMLINEAADALFWGVASREDLELAMTRGVNYPKGLLAWGDERDIRVIMSELDFLYGRYQEDRYRCSPIMEDLIIQKVGLLGEALRE